MSKLLFENASWDFDTLKRIGEACDEIAVEELRLDMFPNQIEIISSEQMLEAYTSIGMPVMYSHWSFGKHYLREAENYRRGKSGLAYELVINSDPCINYFMEENTSLMQTLVYAHASCLSNDTEYLSPTGWKTMDSYDDGLVAQYNEDGTAEFVKPSAYIKRKQSDFIHVVSKKIDQAITDDHTVVFENGNGNLVRITGQELAQRHADKTRGFTGKFINGFDLKTDTKLDMTDDEIRLHIAIKADGSFHNPNKDPNHHNSKPYYRLRFHLKKKRKIDRLVSILDAMNIVYDITDTYGGRQSITFNYPELVNKRFTEEWYLASEEQRKLISEEVLHWDGYKKGNAFSSSYYSDVTYVQFVWASVGYSTRIASATRCWMVYKTNKRTTSLSDRKRENAEFERIPAQDGHAYCFTVPSHMFITRRNGKVSVTGNCGHNHYFKNNYLFKEWTSPDGIVDFLVFARDYVQECSDQYGPATVEQVLNAAHALMDYGVDRYRRPQKLNATKEKERMRERLKRQQADENVLWGTLPIGHRTGASPITEKFARIPAEPQENIMYFLEKQAPNLAQWERELIRIVRKLAQYFFPQGQTKVMNEGFASSVHYYIIHRLWEKGMLSDGNMLEFYASHSAVLYQPEYTSPRYSGYNPYALGFDIFQDIKTKAIARGDDWVDAWKDAVENYRDESAIRQFLSPEIIRKWRMMEIDNYETRDFMEVTAIQDDDHYNRIRETLADEHTIDAKKPMIEVINSNAYGDRTLELLYTPYRGSSLHKRQADDTLHYIEKLWQYPVELHDKSKYDAISGANTGNLNLEYETLYIPFSTLVPGFKPSALD